MNEYRGPIEGGTRYAARTPFIVLGLPSGTSCRQFHTEDDARRYIAEASMRDVFASVMARLYRFTDGRWVRL